MYYNCTKSQTSKALQQGNQALFGQYGFLHFLGNQTKKMENKEEAQHQNNVGEYTYIQTKEIYLYLYIMYYQQRHIVGDS